MATCCATETQACSCSTATQEARFERVSDRNTLAFAASLCINCGICSDVCPHGVFAPGDRQVRIVRGGACMECGACALNCPVGAITVDSGVGCAAAMIAAALRGQEEASCGGPDGEACCG